MKFKRWKPPVGIERIKEIKRADSIVFIYWWFLWEWHTFNTSENTKREGLGQELLNSLLLEQI